MHPQTLSRHVVGFRSSCCDTTFHVDACRFSCPVHGNKGTLDAVYDYDAIKKLALPSAFTDSKQAGMWRYMPLLPIGSRAQLPPLLVGGTPLYSAKILADRFGLAALSVKDEGRQPTGSLKDRASAMAVAMALAEGARHITTASTGNAAAALAGLCAGTTLVPVIFVPESVPRAKLAQILAYGARVVLVEGSYDDAYDLCLEAANRFGWYNRSTGHNPFMTEGKKTVLYEIMETLNWSSPDVVLVGVGDGSILGAVHKGLRDLLATGLISRMPRLIGVQAAGSDYLYQAWRKNDTTMQTGGIPTSTAADSLAAGLPRDRYKAMEAVRATGGAFVRVSDDEILAAIPELARTCGVFSEPAGASALAGLISSIEQGLVGCNEHAVIISTGNGLKDIPGANNAIRDAQHLMVRSAADIDRFANSFEIA
jgi:threonine synthase